MFLNLVSSINPFYVFAAMNFANEFDLTYLEINYAKHVYFLLQNINIISWFLLFVVMVVVFVIRYAKFFRSQGRPQYVWTCLTLVRMKLHGGAKVIEFWSCATLNYV